MEVIAVIVNWLHLVAAFTWVGGLIFVNFVLSPVAETKKIPPEFVRIMGMERFRYFAWSSIVLVASSGLFKMFYGRAGAEEPATPLFLAAFLTKLTLALLMIIITVVTSVVLRQRMVNAKPAAGGPGPEMLKMSKRLVLFSRINLVLGMMVLLAVAVMAVATQTV